MRSVLLFKKYLGKTQKRILELAPQRSETNVLAETLRKEKLVCKKFRKVASLINLPQLVRAEIAKEKVVHAQ